MIAWKYRLQMMDIPHDEKATAQVSAGYPSSSSISEEAVQGVQGSCSEYCGV